MDSERPLLSNTLPKNFQFHYRDGQIPQTPEPESQPEDIQPPPPPRQTLRVRRRRTTMVQHQDEMDHAMDQRPIPTIEAPELHSEISSDLPALAPIQDDAYLSPGFSYSRMMSPPKTPVAQMRTVLSYDGPQDWDDLDLSSQSETSSRPTSSAGFSDSSISSYGSIESFMSRGGSCTSPEEEMTDPFLAFSPDVKYGQLNSPLPAFQPARPAKRLKMRATFTEDMDYHLWMTYMKYLQDPTVTPFKALPGTVPPNGVCHRVARMARKTWKGPRPTRLGVRSAMQYGSRSGTPDTIRPLKSGSSTPVARGSKSFLRYPAEKQCRKRLRDLAKQKPTLAAHYQRLLRRSPSPLQSSPPKESSASSTQPRPLSSPFSQDSSFATRDMNVSLAASTAASMQTGNPLSQLANATPRPAARTWSSRTSAHQKSQSLHIGLGIGLGSNVLGSSFRTMSGITDMSRNQPNAQTWHAHSSSAQPPRLGSPFQLHTPRPISRVFKRRALNSSFDERAARNRGDSFVNELFGAPAEYSHRRVRSRGFSTGDTVDGVRRLPLTTSPPSEANPFMNKGSAMPSPTQHSPAVLAEAQGQATIRLGSPFGCRPSNTFPRASTPHAFEPPVSFEQRFAAIPSDPAFFYPSGR
ncbi:hypothetical protein CC86DRAFT_72605 [Ophiobolus disseminans]|uniref:Uncharacterized protein n=1 Tax=Ophiobolus disseminans TaxID=1469910 RepID=A0A6A6ZQV4_9PLEO|nr:hypothetical protein CC86DRAFT_72605 [Ophiobolus disseminans]